MPPELYRPYASASPRDLDRVYYDPAIDLPIDVPRGYRDAYLGAPIRALMTKANKANHVVSANGESIPTGSSGKNNGGGVAKKKIAAAAPATNALEEFEENHPELPDTRFAIHGFTPWRGRGLFQRSSRGAR